MFFLTVHWLPLLECGFQKIHQELSIPYHPSKLIYRNNVTLPKWSACIRDGTLNRVFGIQQGGNNQWLNTNLLTENIAKIGFLKGLDGYDR
jgi:hypothetical protein